MLSPRRAFGGVLEARKNGGTMLKTLAARDLQWDGSVSKTVGIFRTSLVGSARDWGR